MRKRTKKFEIRKKVVLLSPGFLLFSSMAVAQPVITGHTISWPSTGYYQVQSAAPPNYPEVCVSPDTSCVVPTGQYNIINHSTGQRWDNQTVPQNTNTGGGGGTDLNIAEIQSNMPRNNVTTEFFHRQNDGFAENGATNGIRFSETNTNVNEEGDLTLFTNLPFNTASTDPTRPPADGEGNFRVSCHWSHFSYNDSIFEPDNPGAAHLHMYFGKSNADDSTFEANDMVRNGGGTCQGFAYNRSAYWMPALMTNSTNAIVPNNIIAYYKTKVACPPGNKSRYVESLDDYRCIDNNTELADNGPLIEPEFLPEDVAKMEQGLQLFSGNPGSSDLTDRSGTDGVGRTIRWRDPGAQGATGTPVTQFKEIYWSCGSNGNPEHYFDGIPNTAQMNAQCRNGSGYHQLNATVYFPQCVKVGALKGSTAGTFDHLLQVPDHVACPTTYEGDAYETIPRLGILAYWNMDDARVNDIGNWFLSSDHRNDDGILIKPGGSLHADWIGGWHDDVQDAWLENCLKDSKNCNMGQTGTNSALHNLGLRQDNTPGTRDGMGQPNEMIYDTSENPRETNYYIEHGVSLHTGGMHRDPDTGDGDGGSTSVELLNTGGFEVNEFAGTPWRIIGTSQGVTASIEWQGRDSASSRSVTVGNRTEFWHGLYQNVPTDQVQAGQTATLTGYVKLETGSDTSRVRLRVQYRDDTGWNIRTGGWVNVNGWSWTKVEFEWPVDFQGNLLNLRYRIDGAHPGRGFRLDDASFVVSGGGLTSAPTGTELVDVGDFEVSQISGTPWRVTGSNQGVVASISGESRNGTSSVLVGSRSEFWHGLYQDLSTDEVENGDSAEVSGYVRLQSAGATSRARARVQLRDDNGWVTLTGGWIDVNGSNWTKVSYDWPVDFDGNLRNLRFRIDGVHPGVDFFLDDASFLVE